MTRLTRRAAIAATLAAPALILAARPVFAKEPETFQNDGIAINGIDPVAYFDGNGPVAGSPGQTVDHNGATWHFASAGNAGAFRGDPEKYGAQFGGYCAYAASLGYLAPTQPEAWTIYEDRLYLNANLRARELWLQDVPGNIAKGRANWPGILG